ncbi:MAG: fibronectin type III domain-containing protein [Opitutaceae bacterium]|nr:fibronectin type III domain-containing protein [Opitutaceae bacterium]
MLGRLFFFIALLAPTIATAITANYSAPSSVASGQSYVVEAWVTGYIGDPSVEIHKNGVFQTWGYTSASLTTTDTGVQTVTYDVYASSYDSYNDLYYDDSATFYVSITGNQPPQTNWVSGTNIVLGQSTTLTGNASDPDGNLSTLNFYINGPNLPGWNYVDGTSISGSNATASINWTPSEVGDYNVHIRAIDSDGVWDSNGNVMSSFSVSLPTYTLTVQNGSGGGSGLTAGTNVSISANSPPSGYVFSNWSLISGPGSIANASSSSTTFTMGSGDATVQANYEPIYTLTVLSGSGGGSGLTAGTNVGISANAPPSGQVFSSWTLVSGPGSIANPAAATTTFTMGSGDATVQANYVPLPTYTLTVQSGSGSASGLTAGTNATITADSPPGGLVFSSWTLVSGPGSIANPAAATTTFTMGSGDATVQANYVDITPPSVPNGLQAGSVTTSSFTLSWNASTDNVGVTAYEVSRSGTSLGTTAGTSMSVTGLDANTTYQMTVRACDGAGNWSGWSNALAVTTAPYTYTLTVQSGSGGASGLTAGTNVTITANTPPSGRVFSGWTLVSGPGSIANPAAATTTFTMGSGDATVQANYVDTTQPSVPNGLQAGSVTTSSFTLSWSASADNVGVTAYEVSRSGTSLGTTEGTSMSVTGLDTNTTYQMTVRARDAVGNWSDWSNALAVATTTYTLTVQSGSGSASGLTVGTNVTITANTPPSGQVFSGWTLVSGPGSIANPAAASTTFTMGSGDATVHANYGDAPLPSTGAVAAGGSHTVTLKSDGTVWAWGYNSYGQLGDGTTTQRTTPVQVSGLTGVVAIAAGGSHTVAAKSDGTVRAWGYNYYGQLGDGTTIRRTTPVQVSGLTGVVAIAAGGSHTVAAKSDGTVRAWGSNSSGQLGDGTTIRRTTPVQVSGLTGVMAVAAGGYHTVALRSDGSFWAWGEDHNGQLGGLPHTPVWVSWRTIPGQVNGQMGVGAMAAGGYHTVALQSNGTVWTWGYNYNGQLGDGTTTSRSTPVQVRWLAVVAAVTAGASHIVTVKNDRMVWTWGKNDFGQLGDGTTTQRTSPVQVSGLTDVMAAAAGGNHTVALKSDGTVWAWGLNSNGQLGDGTTTQQTSPVQVSGLTGVVAVAAGSSHTLALKSDGTVWAWGLNSNGQLGDGTTTQRLSPVQVINLTGVLAIAASNSHTVAVKSDGTVRAWGLNSNGQLGDGTTTQRLSPVQVNGLSGVVAIATGGCHTVAVRSDGAVRAWGKNDCGQLGDGTTTQRLSPVPVSGLSGVVAVAAGANHTVALKSNYTVRTWGDNSCGQLGDRTTIQRVGPVQTNPSIDALMLAAGGNCTVALKKSDGTIWIWGNNDYGQFGNGTTSLLTSAVQASSLTGVVAVAAGNDHSTIVKSDGAVSTWGCNDYGQLGDGTTTQRLTSVQVNGLTGVVATAAGDSHTVAVKSDGTVRAWGRNSNGQLGDGTTTQRSYPAFVNGLTSVLVVAAGGSHTVAVKSDGTVRAWGYNYYGQLGDGTTTQRLNPVPVSGGLTSVAAVAAGLNHTVALKSDGTVWAWGGNSCGQLGDGTTTQRLSPVQVSGLTGVVAIAAGGSHTLAVKSDGTVWAWGDNSNGQLGDGTTTQRLSPVQVSGLTGVMAIAAGDSHTVALKSDGTVWAWGGNSCGQLGDGTTTQRMSPALVNGLTGVVAIAVGGSHTLAVKSDGTIRAWGYNGSGQLGIGWGGVTQCPIRLILWADDTNQNGISDAWEMQYFGNLSHTGGADSDSDGLSDIQEFLNGTNPTLVDSNGNSISDFADPSTSYNGATPTLTITGGNNQFGNVSAFNAQPFVARVRDSTNTTPLVNAPVTFVVTQGGGQLAPTSGATGTFLLLTLFTDSSGYVQLYYKQAASPNVLSLIQVTAGNAQTTLFTHSMGPGDSDGDGVANEVELTLGLNPCAPSDVDVHTFTYDRTNQLQSGPGGQYNKDAEGNIQGVQP